MSLSLSGMLEAKSIVVGEKIITNNPWRNELIKKEYGLAIDQALKEHKVKHPKSIVTITRSFDDGPIQGFAVAEKSGALGVAGYLYSSDAFEASELAKNKKIPYLSPVSPLTTIRNDFAFSLAASHEDLKESFAKLGKKLNYPSVIILPETFLTNFEYKRIYEETFRVVKTYHGNTAKIWEEFEGDVKSFTSKGKADKVNVLFAGFAFEHMDMVQLLVKGPLAEKVNIVGHAQWTYCPQFLDMSLKADAKNFYAVSDYLDPDQLAKHNFAIPQDVVKSFLAFKAALAAVPDVKGQHPNEPIVYVLKDMISLALEVAEQSETRTEFNKKYSNVHFHGAVTSYEVIEKKSNRKVYLGTWEGKSIKPLMTL